MPIFWPQLCGAQNSCWQWRDCCATRSTWSPAWARAWSWRLSLDLLSTCPNTSRPSSAWAKAKRACLQVRFFSRILLNFHTHCCVLGFFSLLPGGETRTSFGAKFSLWAAAAASMRALIFHRLWFRRHCGTRRLHWHLHGRLCAQEAAAQAQGTRPVRPVLQRCVLVAVRAPLLLRLW